MTKHWFYAAASAVSATALAASAQAAVFTNRVNFDAHVASQTTVTFEGMVVPGFDFADVLDGQTIDGMTFSHPEMAVFSNDGPVLQTLLASTAYGSDYLEWQDAANLVTLSVASPITAFAFDFMETRGHAATYTINIDGQLLTAGSGGLTPGFFGYTSNTGFSSIIITQSPDGRYDNNFYTMDNVSYGLARGQVGVDDRGVPEPASWALMLMGFGGLGAVLRQRRTPIYSIPT